MASPLRFSEAGQVTWAWIHQLYMANPAGSWYDYFGEELVRGPPKDWIAGRAPARGELVLFNGTGHVALAAGQLDALGRSVVVSFWPPPDTAFTFELDGTLDRVKVTTIEQLRDYMWIRYPPGFESIQVATPAWA